LYGLLPEMNAADLNGFNNEEVLAQIWAL